MEAHNKGWHQVADTWSNDRNIQTKESCKKKGCLSAIPVGSGTNYYEAFHRHIKTFFHKSKIGTVLAYALMMLIIYNFNSRDQNNNIAVPTCWNCNQRGHMQRSCPQPRRGGRGRRRMRASGQYRYTSAFNCNSVLVVDGYAGDRLTHMLIDTGSDVSIVREDIWKSICKDDHLHNVLG